MLVSLVLVSRVFIIVFMIKVAVRFWMKKDIWMCLNTSLILDFTSHITINYRSCWFVQTWNYFVCLYISCSCQLYVSANTYTFNAASPLIPRHPHPFSFSTYCYSKASLGRKMRILLKTLKFSKGFVEDFKKFFFFNLKENHICGENDVLLHN